VISVKSSLISLASIYILLAAAAFIAYSLILKIHPMVMNFDAGLPSKNETYSPDYFVSHLDPCGCPSLDEVCIDKCTECICSRLTYMDVNEARKYCDKECAP
jgi:hypothetical protein